MFRRLARLAEEHELLEALPFLSSNADDEDDLTQDAIAALPPLVARFFFAPRGGPKAPPLLGRCFTLKKLSGTKFRQMLRGGEDIPEWFAYPSVVKVLQENVRAGN